MRSLVKYGLLVIILSSSNLCIDQVSSTIMCYVCQGTSATPGSCSPPYTDMSTATLSNCSYCETYEIPPSPTGSTSYDLICGNQPTAPPTDCSTNTIGVYGCVYTCTTDYCIADSPTTVETTIQPTTASQTISKTAGQATQTTHNSQTGQSGTTSNAPKLRTITSSFYNIAFILGSTLLSLTLLSS